MKKLNILFAIFCTLTLCSCMRAVEGLMKPEASGGPYEVYFVMPKGMENSALNDTLTQIYEYPMEWMPHFDPHFKVRHLTPENFANQVIRIVGNVVLVDIDASNASQPFITTEKDTYAKSQVIVKLHAKTQEDLAEFLPTIQDNLRNIFVGAELNRRINIYKKESNHTQSDRLMSMQNVSMLIPENVNKNGVGKTDKNFFWATDDGMARENHIVVYSIPYTDQNVFSLEGAVAVRDSVMKANIEGGSEGSFVTTNKNVILPEYKALNVGGKYVGELRGMWRVEDGPSKAGAFISHIRLDEINNRVVFAEGFIYAPSDDIQRLLIRNLEAALYTLKLPSDNMMSEVEINLSDTITTTIQ